MNNIEKGFKNYRGIYYPEIRNIHFEKLSDMMGNLGTFKNESKHADGTFFTSDFDIENGVYIYQTHYDKNKALRIYKDYADYKYTCYDDDGFISKLIEKQKSIKLTEFPMGMVSVEDRVIGQEIPYYDNYYTLREVVLDRKMEPLDIYFNMIKVLKELVENDIIYSDVHAKNFMINLENLSMNLIDFESKYVSIDGDKKYLYKYMIDNLKDMILLLNRIYEISFNEDFNKIETLDQITNYVGEKQYLLK